jgi:uncharacterized sulfatase
MHLVDEKPNEETLDGIDIQTLLSHPEGKLNRDALFFHYPHYYATTSPASAIRAGDWKLIEFFEDHRSELYHLKMDPSEKSDQALREPERVAELRTRLSQWRKDIGAKLPETNPDFLNKRK